MSLTQREEREGKIEMKWKQVTLIIAGIALCSLGAACPAAPYGLKFARNAPVGDCDFPWVAGFSGSAPQGWKVNAADCEGSGECPWYYLSPKMYAVNLGGPAGFKFEYVHAYVVDSNFTSVPHCQDGQCPLTVVICDAYTFCYGPTVPCGIPVGEGF